MKKEKLCFDCRKSKGYIGRDNGAHTAQRTECECCGKIKSILPARHWVKAKQPIT
jgi:hypothetical protein